jgi:polyhydroxyalkanoate depolymerase
MMMYSVYQQVANVVNPWRFFAQSSFGKLNIAHGGSVILTRSLKAYYEQISFLGFTHVRPKFGIHEILDDFGNRYEVEEEVVQRTEFCKLLHFKKIGAKPESKVLLVAPMSGHFATLLSGTVKTLLKDHDVYITDWLNIRDIPIDKGKFDFDSYVRHIINFLEYLGPQAHLIGVCQPTVACLVATAVMSEDKHPCLPASLVLMAGPIDVRNNPTKVNDLANEKPISWFKQKLISTVPSQFQGSGRKVYPGFVQLSAFMSMNLKRHQDSFKKLYELRVAGEDEQAQVIHDFYEEYFAIMDLPADFYIETIQKIFQDCDLANGRLTFEGRLVNPKLIKKTFLLTVEGERDDICGIGQTLAAQDLCSGLPAYMKSHHLQAGVGHYGVFNGKRWDSQIYPIVRNLIQSCN